MSITAINFHLIKECNYKCKFCFATFVDKPLNTVLSKEDMLKIIKLCAENGVKKISFAGGEPMLCKWLDELIVYSKKIGLTTMLITNGSLLNREWLNNIQDYLDWISLSIDSINTSTLDKIGRKRGKKILGLDDFNNLIALFRQYNIRFKINTVVCSQNYKEDLNDFIISSNPERWKIFQVLPIKGQSDKTIESMTVSDDQFNLFVSNHKKSKSIIRNVVVENNELMKNSYVMIDPYGRFFDNSNNKLNYSKPILDVGFRNAYNNVFFSNDKFKRRGGNWNWV